MNIQGKHYRTIWLKENDPRTVCAIDQRYLPFRFAVEELRTVGDMVTAIKDMHVRGAGLIGAAAGYGMYLAALNAPDSNPLAFIQQAAAQLKASRPTAVNLSWAVDRMLAFMANGTTAEELRTLALAGSSAIADEDAEHCRRIGEHGLSLIRDVSERKKGDTVNILTHCNAGWLAFTDHGTATAPIYAAKHAGIKIHVWVDETRPRNQGARLTAWELGNEGVDHTVIPDNTGGHLMQHGMVDLVIVGSDRTTAGGDVANKIGTYLKALAARDNNIPFYAAMPSSSIDWNMDDGVKEIPIEERGSDEVRSVEGWHDGEIKNVRIVPEKSRTANYGFDVTPARLVTGIITERGICAADRSSLLELFPEKKK